MASIEKRGDGYRITVSNGRDINGKQVLEKTTWKPDPAKTKRQNEKDLEAYVVDFERDVKSGKISKGSRMTFKELSEQFLADTEPIPSNADEALEMTSWSFYKRVLELRILPRIGHKKIGEISPKTVKDYAKELRQEGVRVDGKPGGLSETTIKKDCAIISSILSYAAGEGYIQINPLIYSGKQQRHKRTSSEYKVKNLTLDQAKNLLRALDSTIPVKHASRIRTKKDGTKYTVQSYSQDWHLSLMWKAYFYISLFIGDRRGENLALTWADINFKTGEVSIDKATAYDGKQIYQKGTKTDKARIAILPGIVIDILKQWKSEQQKEALKIGSQWVGFRGTDYDKNFIFTQWNGKQVHPSTPYHQFKRIIKIWNDATDKDTDKIPEDITPHSLRHTAASILISQNMDPRSVAGILGHSDPTTTLNIYSYFFRTKNQEAADIMSTVLTGALPQIKTSI